MIVREGLGALVLAGSRPGGDPLSAHAGVSHKALIDVGGRTMIERVVAALAATPEVAHIVIAIERPEILCALRGLRPPLCGKPVATMLAGESPSASVAAALRQFGTPLLATTADHALLDPPMLREFIDGGPGDADLCVALARKAAVTAACATTKRTYLRFADGEFSGCNLFLLQRPGALQVVDAWRGLESLRKRPLRMMLRLGVGCALRYRLGRLRLAQAIARLERMSGARIAVVEMSDGRAAIDVDKAEDLALVRRLVA